MNRRQRRHTTNLTNVLKSQIAHACVDLVIQHYLAWETIPIDEAYRWMLEQDNAWVQEWKRRNYTQELFEEKLRLTFRKDQL